MSSNKRSPLDTISPFRIPTLKSLEVTDYRVPHKQNVSSSSRRAGPAQRAYRELIGRKLKIISTPIFNLLAAILVVSLLGSCNDFFVRDISSQQVTLVSPSDSTVTTLYTQEFVWDELNGSDYYQLQIAYPSFASIQSFVLDTTIYDDHLTYTLSPGTYQWRVRGINSSYESQYSNPFTITIDTTSDLTFQLVALNAPASGIFTNDSTPTFSWQSMSIATSYNLIIKTGSNWTTGTTILNDTVNVNNYTLTTAQYLSEGGYTWGVRAINAISYTQSYATRTFGVDYTNPPTVSLTAPSNNALLSTGQITFTWSQPADVGTSPSPRTDSVFIFSDTSMTNLIYRDAVSSPSVTRTLTGTGMYRWYVISFDAAGNGSDTSSKFTFTLQ
ncbi:MAG: hypothetical protein ACOZCO_00935 [Bacteroidota bacterium]